MVGERASSFGEVAHRYDRYRPAPPTEAVEWLLPEHCDVAVDVGAGTGGLTRLLVQRVRHVIAVEPDPRMREVLGERSAGVEILAGRAEDLPVPDQSAQAVVASSAWHWVDPETAFPEAARVLRHGGVLGLCWNGADREVPWVARLLREGDAHDNRRHRHRRAVSVPEGVPFGPPETTVIRWARRFSAEELVGLAGTYSSVITLGPEARSAHLARIRALVDELPDVQRAGSVEVPMSCLCWRVVRL